MDHKRELDEQGVRTERFNGLAKSDSLIVVVKFRTGAPFGTWSWASKPENELQHFVGEMRLAVQILEKHHT